MEENKSWGGSRAGSGRKSKAVTHEKAIKEAEKRCADNLPKRIATLEKLADGGIVTTVDTLEPVSTIIIDSVEVVTDERGNEKAVKVKKHAFPDLVKENPSQLVLVKREVRKSTPDRAANEYLVNRVMGTPTNKHEFNNLSDAELIEEAARAFGRASEAGDSASDAE